jgi:phosphoribosylaminoimidazole carboxylase (NCAIR synthetase)
LSSSSSSSGEGKEEETLDLHGDGWIAFDCEVAVMVVKSRSGQDSACVIQPSMPFNKIPFVELSRLYPACHVSAELRNEREMIAQQAINSLGADASGMLGVEVYL